MKAFRPGHIERLAHRVLAGEVVFFVGAGFSLDSERNTTSRLIARLLARFEALADRLEKGTLHLRKNARGKKNEKEVEEEIRQKAMELRLGLETTFKLEHAPTSPHLTREDNVNKLAREYYHINDWMSSAYAALLEEVATLVGRGALVRQVGRIENRFLAAYDSAMVPNQPMDLSRLFRLQDPQLRGKALFLETMGFNDDLVMAGKPRAATLAEVDESYRGRLRPRYEVLARLAREGLSPVLVTTNYDLLLEGGYRMVGFAPWERSRPAARRETDYLPPTTFRYYSRVADATQFFGHGDDHHRALIVKIHGCTEIYREHRADGAAAWSAYLPSMVFTFREIQDWREDSWSRDFLRTLLRTRTLVFCGYSGVDPVLHNTFRTVYEEMAARRRKSAPADGGNPDPESAPAFFLGIAESKEFHGLEILRAASRAVGVSDPALTEHPNYLHFFLENDKQRRFPRLDELMRWVFHITLRNRQKLALETDLRRIATLMLDHPPPDQEIRRVRRHFELLLKEEARQSATWDERAEHRSNFETLIAWTEHFQVGLLRELALAEAVLRNQGPGVDLHELQRWPWYYPVLDHPDWAAWAVVVEIGLRRLLAALRCKLPEDIRRVAPQGLWTRSTREVQALPGRPPAVAFSLRERTPLCLTIRLAHFSRAAASEVRGAFRRHHSWELRPDMVPWTRERHDQDPGARTPEAQMIWDWAFRPDLDRLDPKSEPLNTWMSFLGVSANDLACPPDRAA